MNQVPTWIIVLQALATPTIALLVAVIGFMQWRTAGLTGSGVRIPFAAPELSAYQKTSKMPQGNVGVTPAPQVLAGHDSARILLRHLCPRPRPTESEAPQADSAQGRRRR